LGTKPPLYIANQTDNIKQQAPKHTAVTRRVYAGVIEVCC
jgi:hypothetical protein